MLNEPVVRELADELRRQNVVLVCGAGISVAAPTNLPLGRDLKAPFLDLIRRSIAEVGLRTNGEVAFPEDAMPWMPERTIEQFHSIFGDDLFSFLDPFFEIEPNANHHNIASLAHAQKLTDVITVNFDYAIEEAYAPSGSSVDQPVEIFTACAELSQRSQRAKGLRLHKPHGTLRKSEKNQPPNVRYRSIRLTIQQIGTALDASLVSWFKEVIRDRSILVTGYSAGDLDIFPALQQAMGCGRVYWNDVSEPTPLTQGWLRKLGSRQKVLHGDVAVLLGRIMEYLDLPSWTPVPKEAQRSLSLNPIQQDTAGILLAAALLCHSNEARKYAGLRDRLIESLRNEPFHRAIEGDPRKVVWLGLLTAGRGHERGEISSALLHFRKIRRQIKEAERQERALPQWVVDHVSANIAYNEAWPLKRPRLALLKHPIELCRAIKGVLLIIGRAHAPRFVISSDVRALAAYFLGEFALHWGFSTDIVAPSNPVARVLYGIAHGYFREATTARRGFTPKAAFHQMRRDEARMHVLRTRWLFKPRRDALRDLDASLEHYRYLNGHPDDGVDDGGAMEGDVARGVHLLLEATRSALSGDRTAIRRRLDSAWRLYIGAKYGSGIYRTQLYEWLLTNESPWWFLTFPVASIRLRHLARLRDWYKTQE